MHMFQVEFGQYDYGSIDYWPNEGFDYMEIPYEDGSRNSVNKVVGYLKANKWMIAFCTITVLIVHLHSFTRIK